MTNTREILENFVATQATEALGNQRRAVLDRIATILSTDHDPRSVGMQASCYPWQAISPEQVAKLRTHFESMGMKPRTVRFQIQTLRALLTQMNEAGLLDAVRLAAIRRLPCPSQNARGHVGRRLEASEIALVLSYQGTRPEDRFMRAAFFVLVTTGMRVSELLGLPANCMRKDGRIDLQQKGSRPHTVWITNPVAQVVREHWEDVPDESHVHFVQWPRGNGRQILRENFVRELKRLADSVGIESFTPHDLRRTVATTLLEQGTDPYILSSILGHAKPETTAIYDRRPDEAKKKVIQEMVETIEKGKVVYRAPLRLVSRRA